VVWLKWTRDSYLRVLDRGTLRGSYELSLLDIDLQWREDNHQQTKDKKTRWKI